MDFSDKLLLHPYPRRLNPNAQTPTNKVLQSFANFLPPPTGTCVAPSSENS